MSKFKHECNEFDMAIGDLPLLVFGESYDNPRIEEGKAYIPIFKSPESNVREKGIPIYFCPWCGRLLRM